MKQIMDDGVISLLWPDNGMQTQSSRFGAEPGFVADLELDELTRALSVGRKYDKFNRSILLGLCAERDVIEYRLDVVDDLLNNAHLVACFSALLPLIDELSACRESMGAQSTPLLLATKRFGELELYVQCMDMLAGALPRCGEVLCSEGLRRLRDRAVGVCQTESFQSLRQSIPELKSGMDKMTSVTIGINLDGQLRPCEATVISINDRKFKGSQLLQTLFSRDMAGPNGFTGISELHSIVEPTVTTEMGRAKRALTEDHSLQIALFQDLHNILNKALAPVISAIKRYTHMNSALLVQLENEIAFLLGAVRLIERMRRSGLAMCRPIIEDEGRKAFRVVDGYYLNLAVRCLAEDPQNCLVNAIVANDISFEEGGTVFILTGPNRGGKTTYLQTIGVIQLLAQAGCYVPGSHAQISAADMIYTHFPVEEKPGDNTGRLGEEAKRIAEILQKATSQSLILLNESISSSSPSENLQISRNVVLGLKYIGLRAVFATHLHELAQGLDDWNQTCPQGCDIVSIVAGIEEARAEGQQSSRTYKVVRATPRGSSFAMDIAQKYGLGKEQILQTLADRGFVSQSLQ